MSGVERFGERMLVSSSMVDHFSLGSECDTAALRKRMMKFATVQLRDQHLAEDVVQETLLAASQNAQSFRGQSAFTTWVFSILRYKIADALRAPTNRETPIPPLVSDRDDCRENFFDSKGVWQSNAKPVAWSDPGKAVENADFWRVLEMCIDNLPPTQARIFMMREFLDFSTREICDTTGSQVSAVHVTLHRARLRLRQCLEHNWFDSGGTEHDSM